MVAVAVAAAVAGEVVLQVVVVLAQAGKKSQRLLDRALAFVLYLQPNCDCLAALAQLVEQRIRNA